MANDLSGRRPSLLRHLGLQERWRWCLGLWFDIVQGGVYRVAGLSFGVPTDITSRIWRGRFPAGHHERKMRRMLARHPVPRDAVLLELGGCLGIVSAFTNRMLDRPGDHVVVEADPRAVPWLIGNGARNGCGFRVSWCMMGDQPGLAPFNLRLDLGASGAVRPADSAGETEVPVRTIDEIEAEQGLRFTALVMNIEGGEEAVIVANPGFLARINWALVDIHPHTIGAKGVRRCHAGLEAAGLVLTDRIANIELWTRPGDRTE